MKKKLMMFVAAASVAAMGVDTYFWTGAGGDNKFSTAANWERGEVPPTDGTVEVCMDLNPGVVDMDLDDAHFKNFTFRGSSRNMTITGKPIYVKYIFVNQNSMGDTYTFDVPVYFDTQETSHPVTLSVPGSGDTVVFNKLVSVAGAEPHLISADGAGKVVFNGEVIEPMRDAAYNDVATYGSRFQNKITVEFNNDATFYSVIFQSGTHVKFAPGHKFLIRGANNNTFYQACTLDIASASFGYDKSAQCIAQDKSVTANINILPGGWYDAAGSANHRSANNGRTVWNVAGGTLLWNTGMFAENGMTTMNVNSGVLKGKNDDKSFIFGQSPANTGSFQNYGVPTLNLNGGEFRCSYVNLNYGVANIRAKMGQDFNLQGCINLNGGKIVLEGSTDGFFRSSNITLPEYSDWLKVAMCEGGLVFDTHGFNSVWNSKIVNGDGDVGAFTKVGAGTLTIASQLDFAGPVKIYGGELCFGHGSGLNPLYGSIVVGAGGTLSVEDSFILEVGWGGITFDGGTLKVSPDTHAISACVLNGLVQLEMMNPDFITPEPQVLFENVEESNVNFLIKNRNPERGYILRRDGRKITLEVTELPVEYIGFENGPVLSRTRKSDWNNWITWDNGTIPSRAMDTATLFEGTTIALPGDTTLNALKLEESSTLAAGSTLTVNSIVGVTGDGVINADLKHNGGGIIDVEVKDGATLTINGAVDGRLNVRGTGRLNVSPSVPLTMAGGYVNATGTLSDYNVGTASSSICGSGEDGLTITALPKDANPTAKLNFIGDCTLAGNGWAPAALLGLMNFRDAKATLDSDLVLFGGSGSIISLINNSAESSQMNIKPDAKVELSELRLYGRYPNKSEDCGSEVYMTNATVHVNLMVQNSEPTCSPTSYLQSGGTLTVDDFLYLLYARNFFTLTDGAKANIYGVSFGDGITKSSTSYTYNNLASTSVISVNDGAELTVDGAFAWSSDDTIRRYSTLEIKDATATLPATIATRDVTAALTAANGYASLNVDNATLNLCGVGAKQKGSLDNYFHGLDMIAAAGALTINSDENATIIQAMRPTTSAPTAGLTKGGTGALTMPNASTIINGDLRVKAGSLTVNAEPKTFRAYPAGLLALWNFDDPADRMRDATGHGFDLAQVFPDNPVAFTDTDTICGGAAFWNNQAANSFAALKMSNIGRFALNRHTISFWVNFDNLSSIKSHIGMFSTRVSTDVSSYATTFDMAIKSGQNFANASWGTNGANFDNIFAHGFTLKEWHMITVVRDRNISKSYLDGVLCATVNNGKVNDNFTMGGYMITLGMNIANSEVIANNARMDEVAVFARALSDEEVAAMYAESATASATPVVEVASGASLDVGTAELACDTLAGGGTITSGIVTVADSIEWSGATPLTVSALAVSSDAGSVSCNHDEENPLAIKSAYPIVAGTLDATSAANLARWTVTDTGIPPSRGRAHIVATSTGAQVVTTASGSVIYLR